MKLKPLAEQTIVITGATSGIGLATARRAAMGGARVILVARDEEALRLVRDELEAQGARADYVVADVGVREQVRRVVETAVERYGGFDTWVNDAGVGVYAKLEELSDEDHERLFQTNYWGVVYGSTEALKHLRQRGGALINIGSISSDMPAPILSAYTASKHAVKGFTDSLRLELMHAGAPVSVTLIKPSGIQTPFGDHAKNYMDAASQVPPPVYAPELVADAIIYAAQHPKRSLVVGGAGKMMTLLATTMPSLADRIFAKAFFKTARDESRPPQDSRGLHRPGSGGRVYGEQQSHIRRMSLYTTARTRPLALLGAGVVAVGIAGWLLRPAKQQEQLRALA